MKKIFLLLFLFTGLLYSQSLTSLSPAASYGDILHVSNSNLGVDNTLREVFDGVGDSSAIQVSKIAFKVNGTILGLTPSIATKTANYTLVSNDYTILGNDAGGSFILTLPPAATNANRIYNIKKINSSTNTITVDANASETIDGSTAYVLRIQYQSITIQCDGTSWYIL